MKNEDWEKLCSEAFESSTTFVDNNYRQKWEDNLRHFQSRHATGSKYHKDAYKYRSRIFRPKTRSVVRGNEAAAVAAFFSNEDVVSIDPIDSDNPFQVASAQIHKEILNIRLSDQDHIPWFLTVLGGVQDAQVIGVVCSRQDWEYKEKTTEVELDDGEKTQQREVIEDKPSVTLIPIENLRISPTANWINPVKTSPYLIELIPMHYCDVRDRMKRKAWKSYEQGEIERASRKAYDTIRQARNKEITEEDESNSKTLKDYDVVWVHRNIFKYKDEDYQFYTIGTELMLTEPKVEEDGRLYVIGYGVIEAHTLFPDSLVRLGFELQEETNEVSNQRSDNVKLVLNKRWKVKRGAQVDLPNLMRNVPGGAVMMNDPQTDVLPETVPDVTQSSYLEQDRLNVDFDELMGSFSASTIQTNRRMNETVGGMAMLRGSSNSMVEYLLRVFGETWVEPVLRQLVYLEQKYETDEMILVLAGQKAKLFQKFGIDRITDFLLKQKLTLRVNVGMGATDPMTKVQKLLMAMQTLSQVAQSPIPGLKFEEITKEIFAQLGYKDGKRFIDPQNPQIMQMQQAMQQMQQELVKLQQQVKDKQMQTEAKLTQARMKEEAETYRAHLESQTTLAEAELNAQTDIMEAELGAATDLTVAKMNMQNRGKAEKKSDGK